MRFQNVRPVKKWNLMSARLLLRKTKYLLTFSCKNSKLSCKYVDPRLDFMYATRRITITIRYHWWDWTAILIYRARPTTPNWRALTWMGMCRVSWWFHSKLLQSVSIGEYHLNTTLCTILWLTCRRTFYSLLLSDGCVSTHHDQDWEIWFRHPC